MMKKLFYMLLFMGMLALPISAFAKEVKPYYIGAGFFFGNVDWANSNVGLFDDIRPVGEMVRLGAYLIPKTALELRYTDADGEESADGEGGKADFNLQIISGLAKFDLPKTGKAQLYGLLGWSSVRLEVFDVSEKESGVTFGFGGEADITESMIISAEYNHIVNGELLDVTGLTALISIKF